MLEPEKELVAKMLRAVLQSNKNGVALHRLQSEYKALTGEWIPYKEMGFHTLETYLKAIPTVVRMDFSRGGETTCYAVVSKETAQIAELVARQRSSKKKSGGQVNCHMRLKYSTQVTHIGKPKAILRKPDFAPQEDRVVRRPIPLVTRGKSTFWSGRPLPDPIQGQVAPVYGSGLVREVQVQRQQTATNRPERKVSLPPRFQKEVNQYSVHLPVTDSNANETQPGKAPLLGNFHPNLSIIQSNLRDLFSKHSNGILLSKLPNVYKETFKHDLGDEVLSQVVNWNHICTVQKLMSNGHTEMILCSPTKKPQMPQKINQPRNNDQVKPNPTFSQTKPASPQKQSANTVPHYELKQKVSELLTHYCSGLWLHALPKVFEDTFKIKFPSESLNMDVLSEVSSVDVVSENPYKAILYPKSPQSGNQNPGVTNEGQTHDNEMSQMEQSEDIYIDLTPPPLVIPSEDSPSVLVVELNNTEEVVIRYVGKDYSAAQEHMEDEMKEFYNTNATPVRLNSLKAGQLVAVKAEEEAWLRAQIMSVEENKMKVLYVDYGFNEVVDCTKVCRLREAFYALPFQAAKCRLAGLEAFCGDPVLVKAVETKACGKILAVEILQKTEKPLVVLYDTSGDEDINVNAACLRELYDNSLNVHLKVNTSYANVVVTNVCSDGTLFCQVPSKGLTKLKETLHKVEAEFNSKTVTSDLFVSLPFCGKICLFYSKGKWARVEITSVHSSRALDVQFLDSGTIASVKVSELREIPSQFLREIISIPPQATRCCLADLPLNIGMWTPDAVLWLRNTVLNCSECSIKVVKIDESKSMVSVYLFTSRASLDPERSINRQITSEELWKQQKNVLPSSASNLLKGRGDAGTQAAVSRKDQNHVTKKPAIEQVTTGTSLDLPPPLPLPRSGEHIDVYVSVACHPGHFVFQPWQELHKLEVLMDEMLLHYSTIEEKQTDLEKNKLYAAKVDNKWYRVLLKGILTNGLVSLYELDYGRHELVNSRQVQPLIDKFRQLPFQAVTSQLAGVKCEQWSEEAAIVFRNNVEKKPLVALIQEIHESTNPWDRKVVAYVVDTTLPDTDVWIHDLMSEYLVELSKTD
ncbi:tudor domain-containing protein 7 isoform X2 [Hyla sarda]|uniref:tudor domain-containing protein 7 isoform X2 n=1 Tax=Hyla sarda TaxID=327740 RepID=UPI0024C2E511|nr:tudor domain-containing protein 7 isoform X2 [Hyla sarda]